VQTELTSPVWMLVSRFFPSVGGTERQALALAQRLRNTGIDARIVTQKYDARLNNQDVQSNVFIYRLPPRSSIPLSSFFFIVSTFFFFKRVLRGPCIFHAHMIASPAVAAILSASLFKSKAVVKVACSGRFGDVATSKKTWIGRLKLRWVLRHTDKIISLSGDIDRELLKEGVPAEKIVRIPNGVDVDLFQPVPSEAQRLALCKALGLPHAGPVILFSGRLTAQKRPDIVLEAFALIAERYPQSSLVFAGDGPLRTTLEQSDSAKRLPGRVLFKGLQKDIQDYYAASHIFVLPSEAEGMSNSLLEAMASGLACIVHDFGGVTDIIHSEKNGFLYKEQDPQMVAQLLEKLLARPEQVRALGLAARETVKKMNAWERIIPQYQHLYRQLMASWGPL